VEQVNGHTFVLHPVTGAAAAAAAGIRPKLAAADALDATVNQQAQFY
jgi:hypothetical protein